MGRSTKNTECNKLRIAGPVSCKIQKHPMTFDGHRVLLFSSEASWWGFVDSTRIFIQLTETTHNDSSNYISHRFKAKLITMALTKMERILERGRIYSYHTSTYPSVMLSTPHRHKEISLTLNNSMFKIKTHDAYIIMKIYKESYIKEKES